MIHLGMTQIAEAIASGGSSLAIGATANAGSIGVNSTTLTTAGITTQASGSTFLVFIVCGSGTLITGVSDNKSNAYSSIGSGGPWAYPGGGGDSQSLYIYGCVGGAGGAGHTFTSTATITGGANWSSIVAVEVKGATGIDTGSGVNYQQNTSGPPFNISSNTLAQANEIVFALCGSLAGGTSTYAASGFTLADAWSNNSTWTTGVLYKIVAATTAVTAACTDTGGGATGMGQMIIGVKG